MVMIDNTLGIGMTMDSKSGYNEKNRAVFEDNLIYGASPSPDCPQGGKGGFCDKSSKCGLMSSMFTEKT